MGIKHTYQSGTANSGTAEVSSTRWNQDHTVDGPVPVAQTAAGTSITPPSSGNTTLFARSFGGRGMFGAADPSGDTHLFQPFLGDGSALIWVPLAGSSTVTAIGGSAPTATGTATSVSLATTNRFTRMKRIAALVTTAATTAVAGFRHALAPVTIGGGAAGDGGFFFVQRWGPSTGVATSTTRAFCGMQAGTGAPTDVNPSGIANHIGMGWDSGDTNIQFMRRDGATTTKIDLGASFPRPSADNTKAYELVMYSPPGTTQSVSYQITDLISGAVATGTVTTLLPSTTTLLAPSVWMSVGGTSSVIGVVMMSLYLAIGGV